MKIEKNYITGAVALLIAVAIMIYTGMNFLAARKVPMPQWGPSVVDQINLSNWFEGLKGTNADTPVYILKGKNDGGKMLILGGTHGNEPSGYLAATTFIENAVVEKGTIYVVPYTNLSGLTHNDPGEGNDQYFTLPTKSGDRTFRFGSRATNPIDQWPDPDVYVHFSSGQQLSGSETRNINRAYPGRADGNFTEKAAYGIYSLITKEGINMEFDLHEASPEYPVINATVAHQKAMDIASEGCINLILGGIEMTLEQSPTNFHGLTHRELGDYTDAYALLMETANASQGRLRGKTSFNQIIGGQDVCYEKSEKLGMLYVPWESMGGHPIEERVGRHLQGIKEYSTVMSEREPEHAIVYSGVPSYEDLYLNADKSKLGGALLGSYLK